MDVVQSRLLGVLAILVVAMAAVLWFQGAEDPKEAADPEATAAVWSVEADQVRAIRVDRGESALRLEQVDGAWHLREPVDALADANQVQDLVAALARVARGVPVDAPADRGAEFGLGEPPVARVSVTLADGSERTLTVGDATPVGFRTYVRAADGGVAAVNGDLSRLVQADATALRDRHVLQFDPAAVRGVRIASPAGELDVHGQGKVWWLDGFTRAEADKVDDLVVGLLELRFDEPDAAFTEVSEPQTRVTVTLEGSAPVTLAVGAAAEGTTQVPVSTGAGRSGAVWADALALLGQGPTDLGWGTAFGVRPEVADTITLTAPRGEIELRRNGPDWQAAGLDAGKVYDAVSALARTPIGYERVPPARPAPEITVAVTEGDLTWTVEVGPAEADGRRVAVVTDGGAPYRIDGAPLAEALAALFPGG